MSDADQPLLDNPTRWLDAILMNMKTRNFPLTPHLTAMMMDCFASQGRTGKAVHYFYSVHRTPLYHSQDNSEECNVHEEEFVDEGCFEEHDESTTESQPSHHDYLTQRTNLPGNLERPYKVRLKLKAPPPYYKVPTDVQGKMLSVPIASKKKPLKQNLNKVQSDSQPQPQKQQLKIDREIEPDWSVTLTAAFAFADSLTHGACGHDPIQLQRVHYNILIKTCIYRGALWRAMHILDTVMPAANVTPDNRSYDVLLSGLARVGDVTLMRTYYQKMLAQDGVEPSLYTVRHIVDGLLNLGDVAGAITIIQDFFNQHHILPPVTTQLKVLEFALGMDMIYEAKRHTYFIQQLWKWEPHYKYETEEFIYYMKTYQRDERLSKEALQHLFAYFGETLDESDFF